MIETSVQRQQATFRDPQLEEKFLRDGFVVVDFASPELLEQLVAAYHELDSGIDEGYYPSLMSPDLDYKADTHRRVTDLIWPVLDSFIAGYEALLGVFMVKHPGPDTEVPPHQDWIIADESARPSMNVWLPLMEITPEMGQMKVLPGSHHWLEGLRGSPTFPTQWEAVHRQVREELMETVPLKLGQGMIYDIRVLHGTPPNESDQTRLVSSMYAIPAGERPIHYYRSPEGVVQGYKVPSNFCTVFDIGDVPDGECFVEIADYSVTPLTFEEMAERHSRERSRFN